MFVGKLSFHSGKCGGVKKALSLAQAPREMHLLECEKSIRQHVYFWAPPKLRALADVFVKLQVNASICVDHTKILCVATNAFT